MHEVETNIPPEAVPYFREMALVLGVHEHLMSVAGMHMGRSRISIAQRIAIDVVSLLVSTRDLYPEDESLAQEEFNLHQYLIDMEDKIKNGELTPPGIPIGKTADEFLPPLRIVYHWAWSVAQEPMQDGFSFEETSIGQGVKVVAMMLDPLVDQPACLAKWLELKDRTADLLDYIREFHLNVKWAHPRLAAFLAEQGVPNQASPGF